MAAAPPKVYRNALADNARWEHVELREDDIIVATPGKCGTTWTQTICALLVFGRPDLPGTLDELSLWVEAFFRSAEDLRAQVEAQRHRRFFKSHTPFDGLPRDDRVTYICVGRDPRDVAISMDHHLANMNMERLLELREAALGPGDPGELEEAIPPPAETQLERVWNWMESDDPFIGLSAMLHHVQTFWERRDQANIVLLHYSDLQNDLEGQMRALADRLRIQIDEAQWTNLVHAATFDTMKTNAETLAPENSIWHDKSEFFAKGISGQWRELLDDDGVRRYEQRVSELLDPDLSEWLHRGPIR